LDNLSGSPKHVLLQEIGNVSIPTSEKNSTTTNVPMFTSSLPRPWNSTMQPTSLPSQQRSILTSYQQQTKKTSQDNKTTFQCTLYGKTFRQKVTLKDHYNAIHLKVRYKCPIEGCNAMFPRRKSLYRHQKNPNIHFQTERSLPISPIIPSNKIPRSENVVTDDEIPMEPKFEPKTEPNINTLAPAYINIQPVKYQPSDEILPDEEEVLDLTVK